MRHRSHHFTFPRGSYTADLRTITTTKQTQKQKNKSCYHRSNSTSILSNDALLHVCTLRIFKKQTIIRLLLPSSNPSALRKNKTEEKLEPHCFSLKVLWRLCKNKWHGKIMLHSELQQFCIISHFMPIEKCNTLRCNTSADLGPVCSAGGSTGESGGFSLSVVILSKDMS